MCWSVSTVHAAAQGLRVRDCAVCCVCLRQVACATVLCNVVLLCCGFACCVVIGDKDR